MLRMKGTRRVEKISATPLHTFAISDAREKHGGRNKIDKRMIKRLALIVIMAGMCLGCRAAEGGAAGRGSAAAAGYAGATVKTGLEVLVESGFAPLVGKRVGLVTNPSGVDRNLNSTVDILAAAPGVELVALFGPEHGVRGSEHAGEKVSGTPRDPATGLPVHSLYGATRKPTAEMLKGIDVMVYDIQDNGCRSYTFISTLGLVMQACAQAGIEVVVLDRPNPLGGLQIDGPLPQEGCYSFVGMYPIPYIYGLTVGELATMINEEGMNRGQKGRDNPVKCQLTVVEMEGWSRDMLYDDTGLPWVMPSPHIPQAKTALCYPASGVLGELGYLNIGVGYTLPFELFGAEWIDSPSDLASRLNALQLPGVRFRPIWYKPFYGGAAGKTLKGVQLYFTDFAAAQASLVQFYVMQTVYEMYPSRRPFASQDQGKYAMFDKVMGGSRVRELFCRRNKVADILDYWNKDIGSFRALAREYYRY